jgi:phage baseplate assembly protein V
LGGSAMSDYQLTQAFLNILSRIDRLEVRTAHAMLPGRTSQLDPAKGLLKVKYQHPGGVEETPWIRFATPAGQSKDWSLPSLGEDVIVYSPSGELGEHSVVMHGGFGKNFPPNHDKADERRIQVKDKTWINFKDQEILVTVDQATITMKPDSIELKIGSSSIKIVDGEITLTSPKVTTN